MPRKTTTFAATCCLFVPFLLLAGCAGSGSNSQTTTPTTPTTPTTSTPTVASVAPAKVDAGAAAVTLTVTGTNYTSASTVQVGTVVEPTTYVSATQLTAVVPATQLAAGALLPVVVLNGSATSAGGTAVSLEVDNPLPAITSFTPSAFATASPGSSVSITGTGFVPTTTITVGGTSRSTTYVSATQVNVLLTVADLATAGTLSINAVNPAPGGGTSAGASLPVNNLVPTLVSVSPTAAIAGNTNTTPLTLTGTNFVPTSVVNVGTTPHATTYVSATQLTTALTVADVATAGRLSLTVVNPAPGGGTSNAVGVTVSAPTPTPVLTSVSPTNFVINSAASTLYVYGSNFATSCQVLWNGTALSTSYLTGYTFVNGSYVNAPYLYATVPASLLTTLGTVPVTVTCPTAVVPLSNALNVAVSNPPAPTLTSISPTAGAIGKDVKVTLSGQDFTNKSVVSYNGTALTTTYTSSTSLTATLPANMNVLPGNGSFTVNTPAPGGGTSASALFTAYIGLTNNDMVFNPVNGLFYASIPSSAGAPYGNTVVSIDPATGALGTPIPVGSEPTRMALTSDGRYLWVGLNGANAVRKVDLVAGTAGLQFSIPAQNSNSVGDSSAYALAALPGATDSVIVSSANFPNYFSIYDSGVVRGTPISGYYTQPYAILTDGSKSEVYASGSNGYQTFTYSASGLTLKTTTSTGISVGSGGDMQIVNGVLYPSNGKVYDAESGALQGTLYVTGTTVASGSTFADGALKKIFVTDSSTGSYYSANQIQVFSATDYTSTATIPVNLLNTSYSANATRLTRWGTNGLAFRTTDGLYSLRSNLVKDLSGTPADLGVAITSSGTTTSAPITFTATVTNNGTSNATDVTLAGFAPSNGLLRSVTTTAGTCSTTTNVSCKLGPLANGATATITVTIQPLTAGSLTFGAQVVGAESDTVTTNNSATATVTVTGSDYNAAPALSSISPTAIKAGSADTTLTINGSGFNSNSVVKLGTTTLTSKLVSSTQLTATVPSANLASMTWSPVTVSNGTPGGGTTAALPLTVFNVVTAGLNNIVYEPFTRKLFTSVGSGSSTLTGNSIAQLTPETGTFNTPVNIGSQPTRLALTSNGKYLYTTLSGANSIARFNIGTNATEFTFSPTLPTNYSSTNGFTDVAVQPGSETVLAVNYGSYNGVGLVDVNTTNKSGTPRGSTTSNYSSYGAGSTRFYDANSLYIYDGSLEKYPVPAAGLAYGTAHTTTGVSSLGAFVISGKYAYGDAGALVDVSGTTPVVLGKFTPLSSYTYYQKATGDGDLGRAFFAASTTTNISTPDGIVVYDQGTLLPSAVLPLGMSTIEGTTSYTVVDVVRWGQDGLAMLTSTGHVYLLRGAVVVPQLLQANTAASITALSSSSAASGTGNTVLTVTGSNFLPGVAVNWNGAYRTTTIVDSTHLSVAIPAADLATSGTATVTAVNPGAAASSGLTFTIN